MPYPPLSAGNSQPLRGRFASPPDRSRPAAVRALLLAGCCLAACGCTAPIGADKTTPARAYRQIHDNPVSRGQPSRETQSALHRFDQEAIFEKSPDAALRLLQQQAIEAQDRNLLFALAELNYLVGERLRHSVKRWEPRDARDYYLASAVHAWLFLFGDLEAEPPSAFDQRFRTACDLYNHGLGWALTARGSTNAVAILAGGARRLPEGQIDVGFSQTAFPWPVADFDHFILADQYVVRGLSVRNRQPGLGVPLVAVTARTGQTGLADTTPCTALLRIEGGLAELARGDLRAELELHSAFDQSVVQVGDRAVPLELDTTIATAYALNQSYLWRVGKLQFLSGTERIPTGVYLTQPYRPGQVPVVFVHGTFSSPVKWAEMANTLEADPLIRRRYQFWYFIYNSGNPVMYSATRLRESLTAKVQELDPEGADAALQQMVVIGHSQGGLLTKLTATDTGDTLLNTVLGTNRLGELKTSSGPEAALRQYTCFEALPSVKRVIFISTPHRGSYVARSLARNLARKLVTLPSKVVSSAAEMSGLTTSLGFPKELRGTPTSLDSMSPGNPVLLALADIPLAPGITGHSIIPVKGDGDYRQGKDGLVAYQSAHVDYVESEFIVRAPHSCQDRPAAIEEVRRILEEHLQHLRSGFRAARRGQRVPPRRSRTRGSGSLPLP
jgi:pimeloyl-ACP methyl ester carboxylesterase